MKILLLTDIPPCKNYTAGLVLDQLARFMPAGTLACGAIVNPILSNARLTPDLEDSVQIRYFTKPRENWNVWHGHGAAMINLLNTFGAESFIAPWRVDNLRRQLMNYAREVKPDRLWFVIQGQTEMRLAQRMAEDLNIPLSTQLWDPHYLWFHGHRIDPITTWRLKRKLRKLFSASATIGTASWNMAEKYAKLYNTKALPIMPCLSSALAQSPVTSLNMNGDIVIAASGKIYPDEVWNTLLDALEHLQWRLNGRNIRVHIFTSEAHKFPRYAQHIDFFPWMPQDELIRKLSHADILYCPYWFDPFFAEITQTSFPGKLSTYLATGRPVFFHGPQDAGPATFIKEHHAGVICSAPDRNAIILSLKELLGDEKRYLEFSVAARAAFDEHLTLKVMRREFAAFLEVPESMLLALE